jgi:hypothetical protein
MNVVMWSYKLLRSFHWEAPFLQLKILLLSIMATQSIEFLHLRIWWSFCEAHRLTLVPTRLHLWAWKDAIQCIMKTSHTYNSKGNCKVTSHHLLIPEFDQLLNLNMTGSLPGLKNWWLFKFQVGFPYKYLDWVQVKGLSFNWTSLQ